MTTHVFTTIGNDDWSRELRAARSRPNMVRRMIAERIRNLVTPSRQTTPTSERRTGITARRSDVTNFAAAGSADREGAGIPCAESGGGESTFERSQPRTLKANEPESGACENSGSPTCLITGPTKPRSGRSEV